MIIISGSARERVEKAGFGDRQRVSPCTAVFYTTFDIKGRYYWEKYLDCVGFFLSVEVN
ncbi:hypothetical protein [Microcoleus sp. B4-D4]|uniref:hypothetical protein n=1 Tax=Microcoleus sp. B4-D4 TaxID=2818667 RepID=UPI002FD7105C